MDALFLVRNGVPFDVAFSLPDAQRTEWVIVMGELSGRRFDRATGSWDL